MFVENSLYVVSRLTYIFVFLYLYFLYLYAMTYITISRVWRTVGEYKPRGLLFAPFTWIIGILLSYFIYVHTFGVCFREFHIVQIEM